MKRTQILIKMDAVSKLSAFHSSKQCFAYSAEVEILLFMLARNCLDLWSTLKLLHSFTNDIEAAERANWITPFP